MPYFLQKASFLPTFLRRVPRGFFSTTSSLEESSLDDDEEDDAFAAVDAGAAASSVLAYLEARSSMSLVCLCVVRSPARRVGSVECEGRMDAGARHSKKPSLTFFFGATASLPATAEKPAVEGGRFSRAARRGGGRRLTRSARQRPGPSGTGAQSNRRDRCHGL